jgi:hypothetical protein
MTSLTVSGVTVNLSRMTNATTAAEIQSAFTSTQTRVAFEGLIDALPNSVRSISFIENASVGTAQISGTFRNLNVNWNSEALGTGYWSDISTASIVFHELLHTTTLVDNAARQATTDWIGSNAAAFSSLSDIVGVDVARNAIKYAFEERSLVGITNDVIRDLLGEEHRGIVSFEQAVIAVLGVRGVTLTGQQELAIRNALPLDAILSADALSQIDQVNAGINFVQLSEDQIAFLSDEDFEEFQNTGQVTRDDGSLAIWTDQFGRAGSIENSSYTDATGFMSHYGTVNDAGHATNSLGAAFRGLADLLGFDGQFGIQGRFARSE